MSDDATGRGRDGGKDDCAMTAQEGGGAINFAGVNNQQACKAQELGSTEPLKDASYYEDLAKEDRKKVAASTDPYLSLRLREAAILHEREARKLRREERKDARLESSDKPWAFFRFPPT